MFFSHVSEHDREWRGDGLRDFFLYKDLGIKEASGGGMLLHLVKANKPPVQDGTGLHVHVLQFQIVVMRRGWARFLYDGVPTLVKAGDVVSQNPGLVHVLYDYSDDMEYYEVCTPAEFGSVGVPMPEGLQIPAPTPWE